VDDLAREILEPIVHNPAIFPWLIAGWVIGSIMPGPSSTTVHLRTPTWKKQQTIELNTHTGELISREKHF
jgi:hypothetical protein